MDEIFYLKVLCIQTIVILLYARDRYQLSDISNVQERLGRLDSQMIDIRHFKAKCRKAQQLGTSGQSDNLISELVYQNSLVDWISGQSDDTYLVAAMVYQNRLADWISGQSESTYLMFVMFYQNRLANWTYGQSEDTYLISAMASQNRLADWISG